MKKHEMLSRHSRAALFDPPTDPTAIVRHNTVSPQDLTLILRRRRDPNRLGFAVHLAYLRLPGRVLGAQEDPPSDMLVFIASQIGVAPEVFAGYARRDETRRAHLGEIQTQGIHRVRYAAIVRETSVLSTQHLSRFDAIQARETWMARSSQDEPGHDEAFGLVYVPFSLAFTFGCDLFQTESKIAKVNWRSARGSVFGPNFRPRDHWGRRQWLRHRARCGGPGQFCFPV
jgi:hypothetical protein